MRICVDFKDPFGLFESGLLSDEQEQEIINGLALNFVSNVMTAEESMEILSLFFNLEIIDMIFPEQEKDEKVKFVDQQVFAYLLDIFIERGKLSEVKKLIVCYPCENTKDMLSSITDLQTFFLKDSGTSLDNPRELADDVALLLELTNWALNETIKRYM